MAKHVSKPDLTSIAAVADVPTRAKVDGNFGLPTGLYAATVGLYLAFIGLMGLLFANPELAIPLVVFAGFVIFAFGVAGYWTKMNPDNDNSPLTWRQLSSRGIQTLSGRLRAGEAAAQVLVLPVLIFAWGLAIAVIVALT